MFNEYKIHNIFWENQKTFYNNDPHLSQLKDSKFVHPMDWWQGIDWKEPGIYILTGGRQIGKSTSTKLLIKYLVDNKIFKAKDIFYLPCDQIDDHHYLTLVARSFIQERDNNFIIIMDEITFVKGWDRGIKALADEGYFRKGFCILTGSDTLLLKEASARFPGRRGNAAITDFQLFPLTFKEYVHLTDSSLLNGREQNAEKLFRSFNLYLKCGGFLRAINELHSINEIRDATYLTFEHWIKGDFEKRGKKLQYLEDVLSALFKTSGTQVTYSNLTNNTALISKDTFIDYVNLLERMGLIVILEAFDQNTLRGFPKKAKKIHFSDPFIADVIGRWLINMRYLSSMLKDEIKVESIAVSNLSRCKPVYYIKAEGEVDLVVVEGKSFIPVEVKWTGQLRPKELKQIKKYKNPVILTRNDKEGLIENIKTIPLPLYLVQ